MRGLFFVRLFVRRDRVEWRGGSFIYFRVFLAFRFGSLELVFCLCEKFGERGDGVYCRWMCVTVFIIIFASNKLIL